MTWMEGYFNNVRASDLLAGDFIADYDETVSILERLI
jgi:hypothetical protein